MTSPSSNRPNQLAVRYTKGLADVIGTFWQFHNERVERGNIPFAATTIPVPGHYQTVPLDLRRLTVHHREGCYPRKIHPIKEFSEAVNSTMSASFLQFLGGNGIIEQKPRGTLLRDVAVPDYSTKFFDPRAAEPIQDVLTLLPQVYKTPKDWKPEILLITLFNEGLVTGTSVTSQVNALFEGDYKPNKPLTTSLVSKYGLRDVKQGLGLIEPVSYTLLDNSDLGLDMARLRQDGLDDVLGCPAGMKVSPGTEKFLAGVGIDVSHTTMLRDFAVKLPPRFDETVGKWFRELNPYERETWIDPEQLRVLSGEARRSALNPEGITDCPHGKER